MSLSETFTTLPATLPPNGTPALFQIHNRGDVTALQTTAAAGRQVVQIRHQDNTPTGTPACYAAIEACCLERGAAGRVVEGTVWRRVQDARNSALSQPSWQDWTVVALWPVTA